MAQNLPVFEMKEIGVTRGDSQILKHVDWCVREGENWALLGGNGSGKTSLLRVLMGYLTPTTGEIEMPDRYEAIENPELEWDAWRLKIGFVSSSIGEMIEPAEPAIDVIMAGRHAMVNYWQRNPEVIRKDLEAAETVLEQVKCSHLKHQYWSYLSQGERQRLLIGRALMAPSLDVLILDEPCAGLDPVARENFLHFIQELTEKDHFKALIMVTHHVEEIIPNITHSLVLREGNTIACGEKKDALTSRTISKAFGADLKLQSRNQRYRISFGEDDVSVMFH